MNRAKSERFQIVSWFSCPRQFLFLLRSSRAKSPSSRPFSGFLAFKKKSSSSHCAVFDCKLRHNEAKHCKSLIHPKSDYIHKLNPTHSLVTDSKSSPNVLASQPRTETQQFLILSIPQCPQQSWLPAVPALLHPTEPLDSPDPPLPTILNRPSLDPLSILGPWTIPARPLGRLSRPREPRLLSPSIADLPNSSKAIPISMKRNICEESSETVMP